MSLLALNFKIYSFFVPLTHQRLPKLASTTTHKGYL